MAHGNGDVPMDVNQGAGQFPGMQQFQQYPGPEGLLAQVLHQLQSQQATITQMLQQQNAFYQQQEVRFQNALQSINVTLPANPEAILDSLATNISEFRYCAEDNITFGTWYSRYEDLFAKDAERLDEPAKVRLLLRKLGAAEHERYTSIILPSKPKDFSFAQTVQKLKDLFGAKESDICRRYRCLQTAKGPLEDFVSYTCRINKSCVEFDLSRLNEEQFKCLVFVCGLKSETDAEIRTRLLSRIEERADVTLAQISDECQRMINLKQDAAMIEASSAGYEAAVQKIKQRKQPYSQKGERNISPARSDSSADSSNVPPSPCWYCGSMHFSHQCNYKSHQCADCGKSGHKEGYCFSAKKSSRAKQKKSFQAVDSKAVSAGENNNQATRRFVPVQLDGYGVNMQFDTASDVSIISKATWNEIGKPPLDPPSVNVTTAADTPLKLKGEFVSEVVVGDERRFCVVRVAEAPIHLLGADMIEKFNLGSEPMDKFCNMIKGTTSAGNWDRNH